MTAAGACRASRFAPVAVMFDLKRSSKYMEFKEKFVGFVDILGFKNFVQKAEGDEGLSLQELLDIVGRLGDRNDIERFRKHGPMLCPCSTYIEKSLDFQVLQVSDCAIISAEISPAGLINLLARLSTISTGLMFDGILCRGYVTRGKIYHTENQVMGSGYQRAFTSESAVVAFRKDADDRGTPFIEIDPMVVEFVQSLNDSCVKDMFDRMVKSDGIVSAIFPFDKFSHSFALTKGFDLNKEKTSNENVRKLIISIKEKVLAFVDDSNLQAKRKVDHYLAALDHQLDICDRTEHVIDALVRPMPFPNNEGRS